MNFEDIYKFFENPPPIYLNKELAVCYVVSVLAQGDSYGTELIQLLQQDFPLYRLSDTVLYSALKFLEDEQVIVGYWKKVEGRGRPRRMYQIRAEWRSRMIELTHLWHSYMMGAVGRGHDTDATAKPMMTVTTMNGNVANTNLAASRVINGVTNTIRGFHLDDHKAIDHKTSQAELIH